MPFSKLKGRDLLLCDMIYQRGSKQTNWKDYLTVVYRDLVKNTKEKMIFLDISVFIISYLILK